jgi:hypothetical protein
MERGDTWAELYQLTGLSAELGQLSWEESKQCVHFWLF